MLQKNCPKTANLVHRWLSSSFTLPAWGTGSNTWIRYNYFGYFPSSAHSFPPSRPHHSNQTGETSFFVPKVIIQFLLWLKSLFSLYLTSATACPSFCTNGTGILDPTGSLQVIYLPAIIPVVPWPALLPLLLTSCYTEVSRPEPLSSLHCSVPLQHVHLG